MPANTIRLAFIKLNTSDMDGALAFWREGFGFQLRQTYDEPAFLEHILELPDQPGGLSLMLVQPKPLAETVAEIVVGTAHGPVGLQCSDIVTTLEHALAAGGRKTMEITEVAPGVRVCLLVSPQGHEIELVQAG
jgi:predicted enzyme related to lactoylglutathione lyase